jgi:MFS superfamily sulfate permease-like transporter
VSLLVSLEVGILCGFMISLVFLLYYAARPGVRVKRGETSTGIEFILVDLDRSLSFPSVEYTRYVLMKAGTNWAKNRLPVVLDCQHIQFADYTAAQGMKELFVMFNGKKTRVGSLETQTLRRENCDRGHDLQWYTVQVL